MEDWRPRWIDHCFALPWTVAEEKVNIKSYIPGLGFFQWHQA